MLRRFHTAVLEKNETYDYGFDTEPMECGWASEATWFLRVVELEAGTTSRAQAQVSPDGLGWCDKEGAALEVPGIGLHQLEVCHFGGWLRLSCDVKGESPRVKLTVYMALKG